MAFQNKNLSVIAYANGFTLWHYAATTETMEAITANGYFDGVRTLMNSGDIVIINASDNTAIMKIVVSDGAVQTAALA